MLRKYRVIQNLTAVPNGRKLCSAVPKPSVVHVSVVTLMMCTSPILQCMTRSIASKLKASSAYAVVFQQHNSICGSDAYDRVLTLP